MGTSRAVEKREKLVAIREHRVGDLEELDAFKNSLNLGTDGAVDDEFEVDIVVGNDLQSRPANMRLLNAKSALNG